jgi:hypothetical protein
MGSNVKSAVRPLQRQCVSWAGWPRGRDSLLISKFERAKWAFPASLGSRDRNARPAPPAFFRSRASEQFLCKPTSNGDEWLAAKGRTKGDAPRSTARSMSQLPVAAGGHVVTVKIDRSDALIGGRQYYTHIRCFYIAAKPRAGAHRQRDAKRGRKPLTSLGPDAKAALNRAKTAARSRRRRSPLRRAGRARRAPSGPPAISAGSIGGKRTSLARREARGSLRARNRRGMTAQVTGRRVARRV